VIRDRCECRRALFDRRRSGAVCGSDRAVSCGRHRKVNLVIPTTVLQEAVYALETFYAGIPETIAPKLASLLSLNGVSCPDARWVLDGIHWYRTKNADFGDALLCAYARHHHCEVSTFDQGLIKKFSEITATELTKTRFK